jgi:hypothetical protein
VEGCAISVLDGQHWETEFHSTKRAGFQLHWAKHGVGRVWERSSSGKDPTAKKPTAMTQKGDLRCSAKYIREVLELYLLSMS